MPTISLTAMSAVLQELVSVTISTTRHPNVIIVYNIIIQYLNNYILRMYLLANFITMLMIPNSNTTSTFSLSASCSEYTNAHAQLNSPPNKMASNSRSILCSR